MEEIYNGPFLIISWNNENKRIINYWKKSPENTIQFKNELLVYRSKFSEKLPEQSLWLQENFKLKFNDDVRAWIKKEINQTTFEIKKFTPDKNGFIPLVFVLGKDVNAHIDVLSIFESKSSGAIKPKHFASQTEAIIWLGKEHLTNFKIETPTIEYKGIDLKGELILEIKNNSRDITETLKSLRRFLLDKSDKEKLANKYALLTKREKQVFKMSSQGLKHQNIAHKLDISLFTVRTHWRNAKEKLNVKNHSEANEFETYI